MSSNEEQKLPIEQPLKFRLFKDNCQPSSMEKASQSIEELRVEHRELSLCIIIAQTVCRSAFKGFFSLPNQSSSTVHLTGILKLSCRKIMLRKQDIFYFLKNTCTIYIKLFFSYLSVFTSYILCSLFSLQIRSHKCVIVKSIFPHS